MLYGGICAMAEFYDFRTKWKIREQDLDVYLYNYWLWKSFERRRKETPPFAYNELD